MKNKLTQEYLKEALAYDHDTGIFTWNERPESHFKNPNDCNVWNTRFANKECGCIGNSGYLQIVINYKRYLAHRLAFLYMDGYIPENYVDHIDRDTSNNKWSNLREVTNQCNMQNCSISKSNTSGITGVYLSKSKNKWVAQIMISRKAINLGSFKNFEDAVMRRYYEELYNPLWTCSIESTAYIYLRDNNLLETFESKDFTVKNPRSANTSLVKGVYWDKARNKFDVRIRILKKSIYIGRFDKFEDAVIARYQEEVNNPNWSFSMDSSSYKYLKDHNLIPRTCPTIENKK